MNIVRLESGHTVPVNADLLMAYGPTGHEAVSKLEAAKAEGVTNQDTEALDDTTPRSDSGSGP
jgi:hypothetical protein